jgi:hypothetical protein
MEIPMRSVWMVLVLVALASCGGGGGTDDSPTPPAPPPSGGFSVSVDRTTVAFDYNQGMPPTSQVLNATWTGTPPGQVFVQAGVIGSGVSPIIPITLTSTSATIELSAASNLAGGTYNGTVHLMVCADSQCNQRIGGTPIAVNYVVNVRTPVFTGSPAIGFVYTRGTTPVMTPASLSVVAGAGAWQVTADQPFITFSKNAGNGAGTVDVFFDPTDLPSGFYTGRLTITGASGTQSVPVTLDLTTPVIVVSIPGGLPSFHFGRVNGRPFAPMVVAVNINTPGSLPLSVSSNQGWGSVSNVSANASGQFTLTLDPREGPAPLSSGTHTGTLRIEVGNGNYNVVQNFPLTLDLFPATFSVPNSITLGGPVGRDFDQIPVQVSLDTGSTAHPWNVTGVPSWLELDRTVGTVSAAGQQVQFKPLRQQATPGTATATLTFTAQVNGDTLTRQVPVTFNLDTHRLIAAENGVSLVFTTDPTWEALRSDLRIRDNLGLNIPWTAVDDASWLTITPSGTTGSPGTVNDVLTLQANPTGLADGHHLATITITSSDPTVEGPERIRVGLWKTSAPPAIQVNTISTDAFDLVTTDPIRPFVYVRDRNDRDTIRIFNVYTGLEELMPITGMSVTAIDMTTSSDGSSLFVFDRNGESIQRINLDTRFSDATFTVPNESTGLGNQVKFVRINGVGLLLTNGGAAYRADDGARVGMGFFTYFDVTRDGNAGFFETSRRELDFTSVGGGSGQFINREGGFIDLGVLSSSDIATSANAERVYVLSGSRILSYFAESLPLLEEPTVHTDFNSGVNNVHVGRGGWVYAAAASPNSPLNRNVWIYDPFGTELHGFGIPQGIAARGLITSGDSYIVVIVGGAANGGLYTFPHGPG